MILCWTISHPQKETQSTLMGPWCSLHPTTLTLLLDPQDEIRSVCSHRTKRVGRDCRIAQSAPSVPEEETRAPASQLSQELLLPASSLKLGVGGRARLRGDTILLPAGLPFPLHDTQTRDSTCLRALPAGSKEGYFLRALNTRRTTAE